MAIHSDIWIIAIVPFLTALVGGIHCVGMCGAIATWAGQPRSMGYHLGRLMGYIGLVSAGAWVMRSIPSRVQFGLGLLLGIAIVATGIRGMFGHRIALPQHITARVTAQLGRVVTSVRKPVLQGILIGFSTAMLPCGWLYSHIAVAAATGSTAWAIITITSFWLGTIPPLWLGRHLWISVATRLGRRGSLIQSAVLIILGLITIGAKLSQLSGNDKPRQIICVSVPTPDLMKKYCI